MSDQQVDSGRYQDDLEGAELVRALLALRGEQDKTLADEIYELTVGG